ncbi:glutathione S-transferase omega-1-like [Ostrea edulis]|uniref:glutathione S-transferase omega-1-like n=1 Tax=Ostrea edulis TaxID=37623 RepID=UPI00209414F6|nr:glutathione S-transferase omega-1-like [Ostrea edulis]
MLSLSRRRFQKIDIQTVGRSYSEIKIMSEKALGRGSQCPPLAPGTLRLYSMRFCPYAQRTRLALLHKNITFETVNINLKQKPDWFFAMNPVGLVPVLEFDDKVVYESNVCNEFLDNVYPTPKLIPADFYEASRDKILWETFGKITELFYEIPKSVADGTLDESIRRYKRRVGRYEDELAKRGKYFGGASPCMVDLMVWPWFERIPVLTVVAPEAKLDPKEFPHLSSWMKVMMELPAVKETYEEPAAHIHFFSSLRAGKPDYDYGLN